MRALVQRVASGSVRVGDKTAGSIGHGLVILLGVRTGDTEEDAVYLAERCSVLRVFSDEQGKMNLSVKDVGGEMLVVSQFTLYGDTRKGTRPSYSDAADPETAERLYEVFCSHCRSVVGPDLIKTGKFAAMMQVELVNDGPVTVLVESKSKKNA